MQEMDAASYLSLPCHESLHRLQHFVRLQYNQGIVSKPQKAPRYVSAVPFQAVHWGNGNPQRYALPVTWKQSAPRKSLPRPQPRRQPGPVAEAAAARPPLALTRGRRMPKNRILLAGRGQRTPLSARNCGAVARRLPSWGHVLPSFLVALAAC